MITSLNTNRKGVRTELYSHLPSSDQHLKLHIPRTNTIIRVQLIWMLGHRETESEKNVDSLAKGRA
jgi:hypothetical protein